MIGVERIGWGLAAGGLCGVIVSEGQKMYPSLSVPLQIALVVTACVVANKALLKTGALRTERQEQTQERREEIRLENSLANRISIVAPALGYALCNYFKTGDVHGGLSAYYTTMASSVMCFMYLNYQRNAWFEVLLKGPIQTLDELDNAMMKLILKDTQVVNEFGDLNRNLVELSDLPEDEKQRKLKEIETIREQCNNLATIEHAKYTARVFKEE